MYKIFIRPFLFLFTPEKAHHLAFGLLKFTHIFPWNRWIMRALFVDKSPAVAKELFGLNFRNAVGLAAGLDKNAEFIHQLKDLGFGFIEIGTVTPLPQDGNPKPRLFRLKKDQGLINRMGFNNHGVEAVAQRLEKRPKGILVGGNIGKNKVTPNDQAINDYEICFLRLFDLVDYFVVNVSSPNTPGLRELQDKAPLLALLNHLQALNSKKPNPKPILLKIAPDLTNDQLDDIVEIVNESKIAGVIATNTTISREGLTTDKQVIEAIGNGGLSGAPVKSKSTVVLRYLANKSNGSFPIIGVGGIQTPQDAQDKMDAGASLVQIYSGFIYEGPNMIKKIINKIA